MPARHFYLLRHHILFNIKFLLFVSFLFFGSRWELVLEFDGRRGLSRNLESPSLLTVDLDSQKKEKTLYPRCGFGACLRCG